MHVCVHSSLGRIYLSAISSISLSHDTTYPNDSVALPQRVQVRRQRSAVAEVRLEGLGVAVGVVGVHPVGTPPCCRSSRGAVGRYTPSPGSFRPDNARVGVGHAELPRQAALAQAELVEALTQLPLRGDHYVRRLPDEFLNLRTLNNSSSSSFHSTGCCCCSRCIASSLPTT
eukprot:GHVU01117494.1.p1 GENE.GHVU01117494.1~~GHVU01117494.1.p1  ORF type:complete len:172 (+),score=16.97 GHVU01117494.1:148-663(+)